MGKGLSKLQILPLKAFEKSLILVEEKVQEPWGSSSKTRHKSHFNFMRNRTILVESGLHSQTSKGRQIISF
jgi:hypothetical protein